MWRKWTFCLMVVAASGALFAGDEKSVIEALNNYAAAMQSMSTAEMEKHVDTSEAFTIFEGKLINRGWADFRETTWGSGG